MSLSISRGQVKAKVTRFSNFLDNFITSDTSLIQLKDRLERVQETWQEFDIIQAQIEASLNEDEYALNYEYEERDAFESIYFDLTARAKQILQDAQALVEGNRNANNVINHKNHHNTNAFNLKLPKISLPEFSGAYDEWLQFFEIFNALIHNNSGLNDIQKFYYLRTCIKGNAAKVIHSLEVSWANYEVAYELLRNRYENKRAIIQIHLKGICDLHHIQKESHLYLRNFLDNIQKHLRALKALGQPVDQWDTILIYLLSSKLDEVTKRGWEKSIKKDQLPTFNEFLEFLIKQCQLLETLDSKPQREDAKSKSFNNFNVKTSVKPYYGKGEVSKSYSHVVTTLTCPFCKDGHALSQCVDFLKLSPQNRYTEAKNLKLCTNCLKDNHTTYNCRNGGTCNSCGKRHNSILHFNYNHNVNTNHSDPQPSQSNVIVNEQESNVMMTEQECITNHKDIIVSHSSHFTQTYYNILSTAVIYVLNSKNQRIKCRCLLDSGSQSSFMTKSVADKLCLEQIKINAPITGISQSSFNVSSQVTANFESSNKQFVTEHIFLIIDKITGHIPHCDFDVSTITIPSDIQLADPEFNLSSSIDVLLGASIFLKLLRSGQILLDNKALILQNSILGWIISGPMQFMPALNLNRKSFLSINDDDHLSQKMEKFWQLEQLTNSKNKLSNEELECEIHFRENLMQDNTGRYTVKLPLKDNYINLGDSLKTALYRFNNLENKLGRNIELKREYSEFIHEYEQLGHMTLIDQNDEATSNGIFYMPHHAVIKASSLTTRLRVVFDASSKTNTNLSLNNVLKIGPKVQSDLFDIILRMRIHNIIFTADITKMYRQILIHPEHRDLQRIVWRDSPNQPLRHYRLNTVTYGTASASFLAIRTLHEVGLKNKVLFPEASDIILNDFYVDDLISGSDTIENASRLKTEIQTILANSGFELRKWNSNNLQLIGEQSITMPLTNNQDNLTFTKSDEESKILGIIWNANLDAFLYKVDINRFLNNFKPTKRIILSAIASIFDPVGLIAPTVIKAKLLIQKLCQAECGWDEIVPDLLSVEWADFINDFKTIHKIIIPRRIIPNDSIFIELHGFSDASEKAYGACIYLVSTSNSKIISSNLICSKSRVAPIKSTSLPRLELCAALLLAQLMVKTNEGLRLNVNKIIYWTDSSIVLSWLDSEPRKWHTFVANRVAEIQNLSENCNWHHVKSSDNPADLVSRGVDPKQLESNTLWWHGPGWLILGEDQRPDTINIVVNEIPEIRKRDITLTFLSQTEIQFSEYLFNKYSTFFKLQRVVAYILRYINNSKTDKVRLNGFLSTEELDRSLIKLAKLAQQSDFRSEYLDLKRSGAINPKSKLISLNPFLDHNDIIRVGGRLSNSQLAWSKKHPIVLGNKHKFTNMLIIHHHKKNLHGGSQLILSSLRRQFWLVGARNAIRSALRKCVTCFRANPRVVTRLMGELPEMRVTPARPFSVCGVDYAGPYLIKDGKTRNRICIKTYICIFVCFITKAIHIEVVTDLTTESFLNAFKRFTSRRGVCKQMYSDNSTTFVGSNNEIKHVLSNVSQNEQINNYLSHHKIIWSFIPARSPHHGGIWETAVKSCKMHLKRTMGKSIINLEDFNTLLIQIEAILNSRPLAPLSNDPNDLQSLTPGHFLIGSALTAIPQENVRNIPINRLSHYTKLQQMVQQFWTWWSKDYLHTLQQRAKWRINETTDIAVGTLVLLKEDNSTTLCWPLGRIEKIYPGADGIVRVVSVKTQSGVYKRAVTKICVLPT